MAISQPHYEKLWQLCMRSSQLYVHLHAFISYLLFQAKMNMTSDTQTKMIEGYLNWYVSSFAILYYL